MVAPRMQSSRVVEPIPCVSQATQAEPHKNTCVRGVARPATRKKREDPLEKREGKECPGVFSLLHSIIYIYIYIYIYIRGG